MSETALRVMFWRRLSDGRVQCELCPHSCVIGEGAWGICGARRNRAGEMSSPYLGKFSSIAIDPIEKKPLRNWRPGTSILSLGSVGCNMHCPFCQNHEIACTSGPVSLRPIEPEELVRMARSSGLGAVAYTYNEPLIHAEYIIKSAEILRSHGIATVLVTNGMISLAPLGQLLPWVDAANVDLKSFDTEIYRELGGSLESVLETITRMHESGVHVELTRLVVTHLTDSRRDFANMVDWIASLSPEIPLHVSKYFPRHRWNESPTADQLILEMVEAASEKLKYVYAGNVHTSATGR